MYKKYPVKDLDLNEIYKLMVSGIVPRPIAFVTSKDTDGNFNLAPFSYFNGFGSNPPVIGFSPANSGRTGKEKDTLKNIREVNTFSVSLVNYDMVDQMNLSSCEYNRGVDEYVKSGLEKVLSDTNDEMPFVKGTPFAMNCKLIDIIQLGRKPGSGNLILGEVLSFYVRDSILNKDGTMNPYEMDLISRMGGAFYSRSNRGIFEYNKPKCNGIGFDNIPRVAFENNVLLAQDIAKLASVDKIPDYKEESNIESNLSKDELLSQCQALIREDKINDAWQRIHILLNRDE